MVDNYIDIFYFDYVLFTLVEIYSKGSSNRKNDIIDYQRIAQRILVKLRRNNIVLDKEIALKVFYIKISEYIQTPSPCCKLETSFCCDSSYLKTLYSTFEYLQLLISDYPGIKEDKYFDSINYLLSSLIYIELIDLNCDDPVIVAIYGSLKYYDVNIEDDASYKEFKNDVLRKITDSRLDTRDKKTKALLKIKEHLNELYCSLNVPFLYYLCSKKMIELKSLYPESLKELDDDILNSNEEFDSYITQYLSHTNRSKKINILNPPGDGEKLNWNDK